MVMYFPLLVKRFVRSRTTWWTGALLLLLGLVSVGIGRQSLDHRADKVSQAWMQQAEHITRHVGYHPEDLGSLLYYLKFAYINPSEPLSGIAIGQSDLHPSVQHISMLALEGQRYDTDLINPVQLQEGNLDLSFVLIFLFPLVVIALSFDLLHEEVERGTWRMLRIQGRSLLRFFLVKGAIRLGFVLGLLMLLLTLAVVVLGIPLDERFWGLVALAVLYVLFWFALCFCVVSFRHSSGFNAVTLLTCWLLLVVLLPVWLNGYVTRRYPVGQALTLTIKQRDEYHKRWDTDKQETMRRFWAHYPHLSHYTIPQEGFSWGWYYAMQQMGDDESAAEGRQLFAQLHRREALSRQLASLIPSIRVQLAMNELARTDLDSYIGFLDGTRDFHEELRLGFYPHIFENTPSTAIDWSVYQPRYHQPEGGQPTWTMYLGTLLATALLAALGLWRTARLD